MDSWTVFASLTATVDAPMQAAVAGVVNNLFPSVLQAFQAGLVIWIAMLGYRLIWGRGDAMHDMAVGIIYAAAVSAAMTLAVYNQYVVDVFMSLPGQIGAAVTNGNFNASAFDTLWGRGYVAALDVWQAAGTGLSTIPILIGVVVFLFLALICVAAGYVVWFAAHIILYLAIAIGPIFFVMYLFPPLRGYFERWVGVLVSAVVAQVMVAVVLSVVLAAETALMGTLVAGTTPFAGLRMLIVAAVLYIFTALLLKEIPGIATALAGGVHFQAARYTQSMMNAGSRALGAVGSAGRLGAAQTGRAISTVRSSAGVTGQSLSAGGSGT